MSPAGGKEREDMLEWTIEAKIENIPLLTEQIDGQLRLLDCPMKTQNQIDVAVDEIMTNVAQYAYYPENGMLTVRMEVREDRRGIEITFMDSGMPYNPLEGKEPDVTLPAEERPIGGLGGFMVKKLMDEVTYEYRDGNNILRIYENI